MRRPVSQLPAGAVLASGLLISTLFSSPALAGPRGSEFDLTLMPAAGGMEGVGLVRPQGPMSMLFGNPSTITQLKGSNAFTLGGTFVSPDLEAKNRSSNPVTLFGNPPAPDGSNVIWAGGAEGKSDLVDAAVPNAAAIHRVNDKLVLGMGISGLSGLGSDFREEAGIPPLIADLKLFGANMVAGYQLTPRLSVGGSAIIALGALQAGLTRNSASVNGFGFGGSLGVTYDAGPVAIATSYKSEIHVRYDNIIETGNGRFSDLDLEQPREVTFGIATTDQVLPNTHVEFNYRFKNWESAEGYEDFWENQHIFSLGAQHKQGTPIGPVTVRAGYSFHTNLAKDAEDLDFNLGGLSSVFAPSAGANLPVTPNFLQAVQATITDGYWSQSISGGIGYNIAQNVTLDLNGSFAFDGKENFPSGISADGSLFTAGMGLTWQF